MMNIKVFLIMGLVACSTSASMDDGAFLHLLSRLAEKEMELEQRGIWRIQTLSSTSLAVNLQRDINTQMNGLWMVEYRNTGGSTAWTEALDSYKKWSQLYIEEYGQDYEGWVKISDLTPGATYEIRSLYKEDSTSTPHVDGDTETVTMPQTRSLTEGEGNEKLLGRWLEMVLREPEKRGVWRTNELSSTSLAVNLQRDINTQMNGLWMVEYRNTDGSTGWTEAQDAYKKWNQLYIEEYGPDYEGWVKISGLTPGATYEIRSLYKENSASAAVIDGAVKTVTMSAKRSLAENKDRLLARLLLKGLL